MKSDSDLRHLHTHTDMNAHLCDSVSKESIQWHSVTAVAVTTPASPLGRSNFLKQPGEISLSPKSDYHKRLKYECVHWHASHPPLMSRGPLVLGKKGLGQMTGQ